jgi:hypothetical protein
MTLAGFYVDITFDLHSMSFCFRNGDSGDLKYLNMAISTSIWLPKFESEKQMRIRFEP